MSPKSNSQPKTPSVKSRARQFSTTDISPEEKAPKTSKFIPENSTAKDSKMEKLEAMIAKNFKEQSLNFVNIEKNLGDKIESVQNEVNGIKLKQTAEQEERIKLGLELVDLREQVKILTNRLDTLPPPPPPPDMKDLAQNVMPLVSTTFSKEFKHAHVQNLTNEIRKEENSLMLYGYKPEGGLDLFMQMGNFLKDTLKVDFMVGQFKVEKIGRGEVGKREAPLKLSFSSFDIRNQVLRFGPNLPNNLKMEKCLPKEYREQNKDFLAQGWQLKKALKNSIKTRVVLVGHILCLQVKKLDHNDTKYDWVMHKEFVPPQSTPTDKAKSNKTRPGFTASPQLTDEDQAFLIFSDLAPGEDDTVPMLTMFKDSYILATHKELVLDTIDSVDRNGKHKIFVRLATMDLCKEWLRFYKHNAFNGSNPTIELLK